MYLKEKMHLRNHSSRKPANLSALPQIPFTSIINITSLINITLHDSYLFRFWPSNKDGGMLSEDR